MDRSKPAPVCYFSASPLDACGTEHRHRAHQMLILTRGEMHCRVSGICHHCIAPSMLLIRDFEPHAILMASEDYERFVLTVEPDHLASLPPHLASLFDRRPESSPNHRILPSSAVTPGLLELLHAMCEGGLPEGSHTILLSALLLLIFKASPAHFTLPLPGDKERIAASVKREIEAHPHRPLGLSALASAHHISPSRLSHLFREVYGISMREFLTLNRMEKACGLLRTTDQTVGQIAEACGFGDLCNFSRCFDRVVGGSPTAYRHRMRGARQEH